MQHNAFRMFMRAIACASTSLLVTACGPTEAATRADSLQLVLRNKEDSLANVARRRAADSVRTDSLADVARRWVADSVRTEQQRPRTLSLFISTGTLLAAGSTLHPGVNLPSAGDCKLHGRVEVVAGGIKDVQVLVLTEDDFRNWQNNPAAKVSQVFAGGAQTITNIDVRLPLSGQYRLILSNRFAALTSKIIRGDIAVTCIGSPMPEPIA